MIVYVTKYDMVFRHSFFLRNANISHVEEPFYDFNILIAFYSNFLYNLTL